MKKLKQIQVEKLKEVTRAYKKYNKLFSACAIEGEIYNDSKRILSILEDIIKTGAIIEDLDYLGASNYVKSYVEKIICGIDNIEIKADWELRLNRLKEYIGKTIGYLDENCKNLYNFTIEYDYLCSEEDNLIYDIDLIENDNRLINDIFIDFDIYADKVIKKDLNTQTECKIYTLKNFLVEYDSYKIYVNDENVIVDVKLVNG